MATTPYIPAPDPRTAVHRSVAPPPAANPDFDSLVATLPTPAPPVPAWAIVAGMCLCLLAGMLIR